MNVLSLFDGMSCGRITLSELGIPVEKYYASEVDKFAIKATMQNFPDTIQLGDVRELEVNRLDKIDLIIGGSPAMHEPIHVWQEKRVFNERRHGGFRLANVS